MLQPASTTWRCCFRQKATTPEPSRSCGGHWRSTKKRWGRITLMWQQILNNLASLLEAKGDYAAAEPLYRRALAITGESTGAGSSAM